MGSYYIGLSTSGHDPSFAIVDSKGSVLYAEASERFFGDKRGWGLSPDHLSHTKSILNEIISNDQDATFRIATSWKKSKLAEHQHISSPLFDNDFLIWMFHIHDHLQKTAGLHLKSILKERLIGQVEGFEHHQCHAVASYYTCPDPKAICLVVDGEGDVGSLSTYRFDSGIVERITRSWGPGSLGTLYSFGTELCGFDWIKGEEWKVMGLAAYGKPISEICELFHSILYVENGKLRFSEGQKLSDSIKLLRNYSSTSISDFQSKADLAASLQKVFSEVMDNIISLLPAGEMDTLILAGGCALNSSYNGSIIANHNVGRVHVSYAPADDGNSIGAALLSYAKYENAKLPNGHTTPYLGRISSDENIKKLIKHSSLNITYHGEKSFGEVAKLLHQGKIVGIFRGRAEFGPRALGNRSILANPTFPDMKDKINAIVKGRESYRPFAPIIRTQDVPKWMENETKSPYMSFTGKWKQGKIHDVPAVVHEDGTGRLQSLSRDMNSWLYDTVTEFEKLSGIPILLNTSFNVMGKPIVNSEFDAIEVLQTTGLDAVLINDYLIFK